MLSDNFGFICNCIMCIVMIFACVVNMKFDNRRGFISNIRWILFIVVFGLQLMLGITEHLNYVKAGYTKMFGL